MVQSSEPVATREKLGWKERQFMGFWCDSRESRGGDLGSQEMGSWLRLERVAGVALSSSACNVAFRDSRSAIYCIILVRHQHGSGKDACSKEVGYLFL